MAVGRQVIPYTIAETDVSLVEELATKAFNSRSALIAKAVHKVTMTPEALSKTVLHLLESPLTSEEHKQVVTTSLGIPADQVEELNNICSRLNLSKTAVLSLIVKGMVLGYI